MNRYTAMIASIHLATALAFTSTAALSNNWERITTERQLIEIVSGKRFVEGSDWWDIRADGSLAGNWGGDKMRGAWKWASGSWCRNYVFKGKEKGSECQHMFVNGNQVRFVKDQGRGDASVEVLAAK